MDDSRRHTRARDADRNEAVDLIDTAYSDGQLTAAEREQRSTHALQAGTLGALDSLTRDLQPFPAPTPATPRRRRVGLLVAAIVVVAGGIGAVAAIAGQDDPGSAPPSQVQPQAEAEPEVAVGDEPVLDAKPLRYSLTPRGVRNFIKIHGEEFGTTKAAAFGFSRDSVIIAKHGPNGARAWRYTSLGRFADHGAYTYVDQETGEVRPRTFPPGEVDLTEVDIEAVFDNLESVKDATGRSHFPTLGFDVTISEGSVTVSVAAGDSRDATGCLLQRTRVDGTALGEPEPCEN